MKPKASRLFYDKRDYELLRIVNRVLDRDQPLTYLRKTFYPYFHPNGIKEMAETKGLRVAYAVVHLLSSLEIGGVDERLSALRSVRDEIIETAAGPLPKNTARALLETMKELVRSHGDPARQLALAHDFRVTAAGKPRIVRRQLRRYHLLEMPEEWNQVSFDDHVHDVNTKGRKSSTHLIMDAWIKGIRRLRVIHYNYVSPRFAAELLEAAAIMDIDVRIGIEFSARFRDKYIQLIWVPRGFADSEAFLCFLSEPPVIALMEAGREVSRYQQAYVLALFETFNRIHLRRLAQVCGIDLDPVDKHAFLEFVGIGQMSKLHLETFIQQHLSAAIDRRIGQLRGQLTEADSAPLRAEAAQEVERLKNLDLDGMVQSCLTAVRNADIADPGVPRNDPDVPALLKLSAKELVDRIVTLHTGNRFTLNLSNLTAADVLELLYDCEGAITRLEIFNLKDHAAGLDAHLPAIHALQQAINTGSAIQLKRMIRFIVREIETAEESQFRLRQDRLTTILHDILQLQAFYQSKPLKARIGSDSTGRSSPGHGMGLVLKETLPRSAQRTVAKSGKSVWETIPVTMTAHRRLTFIPRSAGSGWMRGLRRLSTYFPFLHGLGYLKVTDWEVQDASIRMSRPGNIVTLGGVHRNAGNNLTADSRNGPRKPLHTSPSHLNSHLKNSLKVIVGFVPAFATFVLTKDWWVLAYGGAFIWFAITGLRNVLQSVLGGGGLHRSPLLRWNDYVSWDRLTDSLLYTGFSVPLLDLLVKTVILDHGLGINAATNPIALYSCMALANGIYLSSHNLIRGLNRAAVVGNFFRSLVSIPVAIVFNAVVAAILGAVGMIGIEAVLQKWAAIISKGASDLVAAFIEGLSDRYHNIGLRTREYQKKLADILAAYTQLEMLFPESGTSEILENHCLPTKRVNLEARDLENIIMVHALDMLYFWMYQPRARTALIRLIASLPEDERQLLAGSQYVLERSREISQLFIDGILGDDFTRALSFYLSRFSSYLRFIRKLPE